MKKILLLLLCLLPLGNSLINAAMGDFVVVIDPGHGGRDPGAVNGKYKEKEINLGVALEFGKLIEAGNKDVKVVYTRKTDIFIPLEGRSAIANKAKANLFISIHTNSTAAKITTASGADTYILGLARSDENLEVAKRENSVILLEDNYTSKYEGFDPKSPESYIIFEFMTNKYMDQSLEFAGNVQSGFKTIAKRQDRGVKQAGFLVLRKSSMPSVLIELGFINNPTESKYLDSSAGQKAMAQSIYAGFSKYKDNFDRMQGSNTIVTNTSTPQAQSNTQTNSTNVQSQSTDIEYRVQFLSSPSKLPKNSAKLKGIAPVDFYIDGKTYKYTHGSTNSLKEITNIQNKLRKKFKDCFIIKMKDGKRIK